MTRGGITAPAAGISKLQGATKSWNDSLLSGAKNFADMFGVALDSIGGALLNLGASAASGIGAALAVGLVAATREAMHFNNEMELAKISMATMANANGSVKDIGGGMRIAGDVLSQMRKDAVALPGEFKDLQGILTQIMPGASHMGIGMFGAEKLAASTMATAAIARIPMATAGRELNMMMEGTASHRMPLFNALGMGLSAKEFNQLAPEKRLEKIRDAFARLQPGVDLFTNSWEGIKTTGIDKIRIGLGALGGPLFESAKDVIGGKMSFNEKTNSMERKGGLLGWLNDNREAAMTFGQQLSYAIEQAFMSGVHWIQHWYPIAETFGRNLYHHIHNAFSSIEPLLQRMSQYLEKFMLDPQAFEKLERIVAQFVALRVGTGAASLGFSGASALGGSGLVSMETMAAAAGPAALAVAGLAIAAYGAVDVLTDSTAVGHAAAVTLVKSSAEHAEGAAQQWASVGEKLRPVADALGVGLLAVLDQVIRTFEAVGWAANGLAEAFQKAYSFLEFGTFLKPGNEAGSVPINTPGYGGVGDNLGIAVKNFNAIAEVEKNKIPKTEIHNHIGHVEIKVNSNEDPSRIAKRTLDVFSDAMRNPRVAGLTGNPRYTP